MGLGYKKSVPGNPETLKTRSTLPFAGMIRIRFNGYNLSAFQTADRHPG